MNFECKIHGTVEPVFRRVGPHIGTYCPICDTWIKWVSKFEAPSSLSDDVTTGPKIRLEESDFQNQTKTRALLENFSKECTKTWAEALEKFLRNVGIDERNADKVNLVHCNGGVSIEYDGILIGEIQSHLTYEFEIKPVLQLNEECPFEPNT